MTVAESRSDSGLVHSVTSDPDSYIAVTEELNAKRRLRCMKHGTITAARLHDQETASSGFRYRAATITLTYADVDGWSPRHLSEFLHCVRQFLKRRGDPLRYTWVMELQRRGAPHYHLLIWLRSGKKIPKPDSVGWWKHGLSEIRWARNAVGYIAKYASKGGTYEHSIPRGARIHGTGGLLPAGATERRWWLFPRWVRDRFDITRNLRRCPGGGVYCLDSGEWAPSPWVVCKINGAICIIDRGLFDEQVGKYTH